jgi:hypothetical protein
MNRRLFFLSALALTGCATTAPPVVQRASPAVPSAPPGVRNAPTVLAELEPLYRADAGREAITVSVASSGCTTKADFAVHVEQVGGATTLAFGRKRIDTCKSFAMGRTDLVFTWAELGVASRAAVVLLNPLAAWTGPGS